MKKLTKEEQWKKVIEKAEKGGYLPKIQYIMNPMAYQTGIIFSHDFLKSYFEKRTHDKHGIVINLGWREHGQQLLFSKDRLAYLVKFL